MFRELNTKSTRLAPIRGERVSYIIASNPVGEHKKVHSAGIFGSSVPTISITRSITSHAVFIEDFLSNPKLEINYDYYVTRKLFPALMRFFQFKGIRLKWRCGEANRNFCLG